MSSQLPALQILVPLLSAPIALLLRNQRITWLLALIVSWITFAIAVGLFIEVSQIGVISYEMGSWAPPWGIEYRIDAANVYVLLIVSSIGALVVTYSPKSIAAEIDQDQHYLFWTAYLLCIAGLLGVTITGDAFNIFVFLEISSLSTYVLIALGRDKRALYASFRYLIMGTIGATFIVIGIGLLYLMTGTLNLFDLTNRLSDMSLTRPQLTALAFLTVGISLKLALFPLHLWLPNAYAFAPSVATSFLAATATKVAVYLLLRFAYGVFGKSEVFSQLPLGETLLVLSIAAMFIASTVAIFQTDVKRLFAYSSVSQIGYITLGASFASEIALTGSIVHLFNHAITKGAVFLLLGGVALHYGQPKMKTIIGLGKKMPWTAAGIVICGLSLIGVPGTAGFISKWYLVLAALERGWWWLSAMILVSSLLAVVYTWRVVELMYFKHTENQNDDPNSREAPISMLLVAGLLVFATIYFGIDTSLSVGGASEAAKVLLRIGS